MQSALWIASKRILFELLYQSGLVRLWRRRSRRKLLVVIYHDVLPAGFSPNSPLFGMAVTIEEFRWQIDYLRRHYNFVSLGDVVRWVRGEASLPERAVLVTFDDGHVSNYKYALPVLKANHVPAVFFLLGEKTGLGAAPTWCDELYARVMFSSACELRTAGRTWLLDGSDSRKQACGELFDILVTMSVAEQRSTIDGLRAQLPFDAGSLDEDRFKFVSVEQAREMTAAGCEIGGHSMTHPILATLSDDEARTELQECKRTLEASLGSRVRGFAYPFGTPNLEFTGRDASLAQCSGYELAFSGVGGLVDGASDRYALPRIGIVAACKPAYFAALTSGLLHDIDKVRTVR